MRLTSQHDHQSLLAEERHLALLDEALGIEPGLDAEAAAVREAEARLKARRSSESEREQRLEWLAEQLADLDKLAPKPGEWAHLRADGNPCATPSNWSRPSGRPPRACVGLPKAETAHRALARAVGYWPDRGRAGPPAFPAAGAGGSPGPTQDQAIRWSKEGVDRIEALEARLALDEKLARRHHCEPEELAAASSPQGGAEGSPGRRRLGKELELALAKAAEAYRIKAEALHRRRAKRSRSWRRGPQAPGPASA